MSSKLEANAAFEASFRGLLCRQRVVPTPLPANLRTTNLTAIVTGGNGGIGLAACRQLLELGLAHLIMAVRSQAKGDAAAIELRKAFPDAQISVWILDMESYDSIRTFAEKCASLPRVDITILNAGVMPATSMKSAGTGHDLVVQVDYLSTVFLAMMLVPVLRSQRAAGAGASKPPVLSIVGSDMAYSHTLKTKGPILAQFDDPKSFGQMPTYANAKMLLMMFVAKLAELVKPEELLINLCNPGMTKGTSLGHDSPMIAKKIFGVAQHFLARTPEVGASCYINAVLSQGPESHGSFVSDWSIKPFVPLMYTEAGRELQVRLIDETMDELRPAGATLPEML
ncbi:hypothetical protein HYFRA_00004366 [Hymenoscyphus fraxineus]|uniref:Uncharacterized protein n=1 Tax=Hymenoscyphus fraxineus TaxID=746836 RepID=A0A9N9PQ26_9HELO|nr:hypothetical protein HYFRA_00004366 [Hymenoscyphus fraxineus]